MPILPVLDLMQGQVVRGVGGRRDQYRPIVSKICDSAEPLAVARAFQKQFGFTEFYVADLDAIQHGRIAMDVHRQLRDAGFQLWIDAGLRTCDDETLTLLLNVCVPAIIVGLESIAGPEELHRIVERAGADRTVFSLDLKNGTPMGNVNGWRADDPWAIANRAIVAFGVRRLIVLDLANVGVGAGVGTRDLCMRLKSTFPELQLTTGGGVRNIDDVYELYTIGVDYVLVASALHDGRIKTSEPEA
jgi:phosphoribosylformimino-5-aminoimidazole carboxamide ribotide isomerase